MISLSCDLLEEFFKFKRGKEFDKEIIAKLFKYLYPFRLGKYQVEKIGLSDEIVKSIADGSLIKIVGIDKEKELIKNTKFKVMLTKDKSYFPYINIKNDIVETKYSATFWKNDKRDKAKEHFKALLSDAKFILICDRYLIDNWNNIKELFTKIIPKRQLNLYFVYQISQEQKTELKQICKDWNLKDNKHKKYKDLHDRYLVIDNKLEIILTSGFDYLFDYKNREFTYIINELKE